MENKEKRAERFYESFLTHTETFFRGFISKKELDFVSIQKIVKMACEFVQLDRNHIVYVMQTAKPYKNPHVSHAVRSSLIAIIIGAYLKMPRHQLIELGIADLLGNISLLNMSEQVYTIGMGGTDLFKAGTDKDNRLMYVHPVHANMTLKSLDFPLPICEAVLQHHELEDGSGFPQKLKGNSICQYAKILAVAGFYEAFSMEHLNGAKCGHSGIIRILKNSGSFDPSVIRALVNSISVYPVGIYVLLSNGKRGQVIDIDHDNPRFPIVKTFGEKFSTDIVKISDENAIVRPLTSEEVDAIPVPSVP